MAFQIWLDSMIQGGELTLARVRANDLFTHARNPSAGRQKEAAPRAWLPPHDDAQGTVAHPLLVSLQFLFYKTIVYSHRCIDSSSKLCEMEPGSRSFQPYQPRICPAKKTPDQIARLRPKAKNDILQDMILQRGTWLLLSTLLCFVAASACAKRESSTHASQSDSAAFETLELRYQGFTSTVTFPELAEDLGYLAPIKLNYVGNTISGPQDIQSVATGDTDFGGAFNGAIVKLVAAKAPIEAVIGYYGADDQTWVGFYVLENSSIRSARDLIGKKIAVNTVGAHAEFVLREYLARSGLSKAEVDQVTLVVIPPVSAEQALRQGQVDVAALTNVLRDKALERGNIRKLFSDFEMLGKFTAGSYVLAKNFIRDKPKSAHKFVEATANAIEWARTHPREEVIARFDAIIKRRARNEDTSIVKYWRTTGVSGKGGSISDGEFQLWIDWLVKNGQLASGQLRPSDVFTNELNPFRNTGPT